MNSLLYCIYKSTLNYTVYKTKTMVTVYHTDKPITFKIVALWLLSKIQNGMPDSL